VDRKSGISVGKKGENYAGRMDVCVKEREREKWTGNLRYWYTYSYRKRGREEDCLVDRKLEILVYLFL
jgi:hypothetical protein